MNIRNEINSLIAKRGTTLKAVCEEMSKRMGRNITANNMSNKFSRKTVKFEEILLMLDILECKMEIEEK